MTSHIDGLKINIINSYRVNMNIPIIYYFLTFFLLLNTCNKFDVFYCFLKLFKYQIGYLRNF